MGNCDKFYFIFEFEVQMWVQIYQIFERDQLPIRYLWNKSKPNTNKPKEASLQKRASKCTPELHSSGLYYKSFTIVNYYRNDSTIREPVL